LIFVDTIELEAESGPEVFSEMVLKNIWLGIDIKETRHVMVTGKVYHMEVFDVMPLVADGSILYTSFTPSFSPFHFIYLYILNKDK
jgi:hypothetical protein